MCWRAPGIETDTQRLAHVIMYAELEQVVCSGPRRGKQFTYALLDQRVPAAKVLRGDAALAALTERYFSSHGPATVKDYAWWSGLTVRDATRGIEIVGSSLERGTFETLTCWSVPRPGRAAAAPHGDIAYLLPNYDEYLIAHKDRHPVLGHLTSARGVRPKDAFPHHLIVDASLAGSWRPTLTAESAIVDVQTYERPGRREREAIEAAVQRYGRFLKRDVTVRGFGSSKGRPHVSR